MGLANSSIWSHDHDIILGASIFKMHPLSTCQVHNTVLVTLITMLHIRSTELFHLIVGSLYPLFNTFPFSHSATSGNCYFRLYFMYGFCLLSHTFSILYGMVNPILFHSSTDKCLVEFHILAVVNIATMVIGVQIYL